MFGTPMPRDSTAFLERPAASAFRGSIHNESRMNSSFSMSLNVPLHFGHDGTVQRWTSPGVVSGYHERGNTWSLVFVVRGFEQWTQTLDFIGLQEPFYGDNRETLEITMLKIPRDEDCTEYYVFDSGANKNSFPAYHDGLIVPFTHIWSRARSSTVTGGGRPV